ncbi:MAG: response regulator [Myxococcota bacterium]
MSKTLLLADDSVVIQKLVGLSFANEDVDLVSTDNGDDAVLKAREIRPDVVLADVVMPGKSGYEVCEAIKKDPALAHVPVLLLTGTFEAFDESRAASVGADGHITKPFEAQALVERVKTVMKNAAARPAAAPAAPSPPTDGLFFDAAETAEEDAALLAPPSPVPATGFGDDLTTTDDGFLGLGDSLDVTPSLSETDLSEGLDGDLFGPPGEIGGPSFGSTVPAARPGEATPRFDPTPIPAPRPIAATPLDEATVADASQPNALASLHDDLGFDEPLELDRTPTAALDLDAAFDPEPPRSAKIQVAQDDANAMTSRSLGRSAGVTDLDELLAAPAPAPAPAPTPSDRIERRPEPPVALDFGPAEQAAGDLDFGFDVSEQAPIAKVDLLEESFSSLLDVSESQLLADPPTPMPASTPTASAAVTPVRAPLAAEPLVPEPLALDPLVETSDATEFDVSSSDLATSTALFVEPAPVARTEAMPPVPAAPAFSPPPPPAASPTTPPPLPPRVARPELDLDLFLDTPRAPSEPAHRGPAAGDAAAFAAKSERRAVDDLSPILQQRVHETLEKVAWEAFSDLSETIVKQVIERVERIAWEVIPQMAETLVREEIRKLKGEGD